MPCSLLRVCILLRTKPSGWQEFSAVSLGSCDAPARFALACPPSESKRMAARSAAVPSTRLNSGRSAPPGGDKCSTGTCTKGDIRTAVESVPGSRSCASTAAGQVACLLAWPPGAASAHLECCSSSRAGFSQAPRLSRWGCRQWLSLPKRAMCASVNCSPSWCSTLATSGSELGATACGRGEADGRAACATGGRGRAAGSKGGGAAHVAVSAPGGP